MGDSGRVSARGRRVVITGLGVCSPFGIGREIFWRGCLAGRRVIAPIPSAWSRYAAHRSRHWAPLPPYDPAAHGISPGEAMRLDPASMLCLIAADEAIADAGLRLEPTARKHASSFVGIPPARAGCVIGNGAGGISSLLMNHLSHLHEHRKEPLKRMAAEGATVLAGPRAESVLGDVVADIGTVPRFNPFVVTMQMPNASAAQLGLRYSLQASTTTLSMACASGTIAIGHAYRAVAGGYMDLALAGGTESLADPSGSVFRAFDTVRTLTCIADPDAPGGGPFDRDRNGFLFAEGGSAVLTIESLEHARARGARVLAEIVGFQEASDAHSIMASDPGGGIVEAMVRRTLEDAALDPSRIDYINAHGTGTTASDEMESAVIERTFPHRPFVNSTKSLIGHTIGASGAIEAAVACLGLERQRLHPSANLVAPVRDLNFVTDDRERRIRTALSLSFAFGGHSAALLLAAAP